MLPEYFHYKTKSATHSGLLSLPQPLATPDLLSVPMDLPFLRYTESQESSYVPIMLSFSKHNPQGYRGHTRLLSLVFSRSATSIHCKWSLLFYQMYTPRQNQEGQGTPASQLLTKGLYERAYEHCIYSLFTAAKRQRRPKEPSTDEWRHPMWSVHPTEYYLALKRSEARTQATTRMNLEGT